MSDLFKLASNNLKKSKKQSILVIVAIMLVCMLLFLASIVASIYRETLVEEALKGGDFHAILVNAPYDGLSVLQNNSTIKSVKVIEELSTYTIEKENEIVNVYIRGTDIPFDDYIALSKGRLPENDHEIIIDFPAEYNDIKIGDIINGFTIVGYYIDSNFNRSNYYLDKRLYAYTFKEISENCNKASFIINLKSPGRAYKKFATIAKEINSEETFYNESLLSAYGQYRSYTEQKSYNCFLYMFLAVVSVFCGFITYNAFNISLNERKKQYGILRSIGASKKQIYILCMFEILIISIISIPISLLLSIGISYIILAAINNILSGIVSTIPFYIYWPYIIKSLLFILGTIFISASIPAVVSSKTSPFNLIRNTKDKKIRKVKENYPLIKKLFGEEGEIAYKNRKRNSQKFLGPIVTLTLSLILFICVSSYVNYLKLNIETEMPKFPDFHIVLDKSATTNPVEIANYIKNMDYIDDYVEYKWHHTSIKLDNYFSTEAQKISQGEANINTNVYALDDNSFKKYQQQLNTNSEVIFYNWYKYRDESSGEENHIELLNKDTKNITLIKRWINSDETSSFYISNMFVTNDNYLNTFSQHGIVISLSYYEKNYNELPLTEYTSETGNHNEQPKNRINIDLYSKEYKKLNGQLSKYIEKQDENSVYYEPNIIEFKEVLLLYNLIFAGLFSIVGFIGLIASLSIFNSITANMNLRSREFSMLRSVGLSHKSLLKMVNLESIFLIFTPLLYGLPISYILVLILIKISEIHRAKSKIYMPFPTAYVIVAVISLIILVLITMLYNYNKLRKKNIIDDIREEI